MNSNFKNDVQKFFTLPSVSDGTMKGNNWLTRLYNTGIEIDQNKDGQTVYKLNGNEFVVDPAIDTLLSFEGIAKGFGDNKGVNSTIVEASLKLRSEGFVTQLQKNSSGAEKQDSSVLESDEKLMTAEQYRAYVLGERELYRQSLVTAFDLLKSSELFTQTWLEQGSKKLEGFKIEFNPDQQEIYDGKVESEEKARKRMQVLTDAGFSKIMPCIGYKDAEGKSRKFNGFAATINLKDYSKAERQAALLESNYIPVHAVQDSETSGTIYFKESSLEDSLI